jgi:hypothetical protein
MSLRPIAAMEIPGVEPAASEAFAPEFLWVAPETLFVDEDYQRNLSERSVTLIRRIVAQWSWLAFKPPICIRDGDALHVIDGQHTAIAAASHPAIKTIPIMLLPAVERESRALSFVRHNRDRIQVTPHQVHFALVAAGDPDALTLKQICDRARARVLKYPPSYGRYRPGDIMAIGALRTLLGRRYAAGARRVVQICAQAQLAPISRDALRAVEYILFDRDYAGSVEDADLTTAIRAGLETAEREASRFAAEHDMPLWRALAIVWFRACKKKLRHGP